VTNIDHTYQSVASIVKSSNQLKPEEQLGVVSSSDQESINKSRVAFTSYRKRNAVMRTDTIKAQADIKRMKPPSTAGKTLRKSLLDLTDYEIKTLDESEVMVDYVLACLPVLVEWNEAVRPFTGQDLETLLSEARDRKWHVDKAIELLSASKPPPLLVTYHADFMRLLKTASGAHSLAIEGLQTQDKDKIDQSNEQLKSANEILPILKEDLERLRTLGNKLTTDGNKRLSDINKELTKVKKACAPF
jgi:Flp pilus assembly CpaE family ATPase